MQAGSRTSPVLQCLVCDGPSHPNVWSVAGFSASPLQGDLRRGLDKKEEWKKMSDTVEVMSVPTNLCTEASLRGYYAKFGKVVRILVDEQVLRQADSNFVIDICNVSWN